MARQTITLTCDEAYIPAVQAAAERAHAQAVEEAARAQYEAQVAAQVAAETLEVVVTEAET